MHIGNGDYHRENPRGCRKHLFLAAHKAEFFRGFRMGRKLPDENLVKGRNRFSHFVQGGPLFRRTLIYTSEIVDAQRGTSVFA